MEACRTLRYHNEERTEASIYLTTRFGSIPRKQHRRNSPSAAELLSCRPPVVCLGCGQPVPTTRWLPKNDNLQRPGRVLAIPGLFQAVGLGECRPTGGSGIGLNFWSAAPLIDRCLI